MSDRFFNEAAKRRKIEELRQEQERLNRDQQRESEREAAKRKPHCSSWQDPAFCDRVIARAERHAKALAEIRSGKKTSRPTARKQWDRAIEAATLVCSGDRAKAVMMADKENPGLRLKMLAEINKR